MILNPRIKTPSKQLKTGELHTSKNYTERISGNVQEWVVLTPNLQLLKSLLEMVLSQLESDK